MAIEQPYKYMIFLPPQLYHVWVDFDRRDEGAMARHLNSVATWELEYPHGPWVPMMMRESSFERNSSCLGDPRTTPFIKDIFDRACNACLSDLDIVVFSNEDILFCPGLTEMIYDLLQQHPCMWGSRTELRDYMPPITPEKMKSGYKHVGADLFVFQKHWWQKQRDDYPDMLLAYEAWDLVLRKMMRRTGGIELASGIAHIIHTPYWAQNRNVPGSVWNRDRARDWLIKNNEDWS